MTNSKSDIEELKNLQREATEQRAKRKRTRSTARQTEGQQSAAAEAHSAATKTVVEDSASEAQAHEAEEAIQDLAGQIETAVTRLEETASERPALALLAAFSLGVIVGQLFSRR